MVPMVVSALVLSACVTDTVFVDTPLYEEPPAAAQGFLGYSDHAAQRPACGNCHIGQFNEWKGTAHTRAWQDLQTSGQSETSCEGCHTVSGRGNPVTEVNVGWVATKDERYQDVQCESCHGPGLQHVTNPDATQPLASIEVGPELKSGCGECHQGAHNPFVDEWAVSRHGKRDNHASENVTSGCVACHEARGVFAAWGIKSEYVEKEGHAEVVPITCPVCHDPHDASNPKQLRFPIGVANVETNLCMKCHHRRSEPDPKTPTSSPHSPQGPLLLGSGVGWIPPNFTYSDGQIVATHGTERNPRLCAGCHVNRIDVRDPLTGDFVLQTSGHLFKSIPCLDAQGIPTASDNCTIQQRSFKSCTSSGCHGSEAAARGLLTVVRTRIGSLVTELNALLARVPASELNNGDNRLSTAEGATFNALLADTTKQKGSAIHNPFLVEALLTASIKQVKADYGLQSASGIDLSNILGPAR
jgi:predicted CXXCH cytochrome family protein